MGKSRFANIKVKIALAMALLLTLSIFNGVLAGHNGAKVDIDTGECGETTFSAAITDPNETHKVGNMRLVVHVDGETQVSDPIPTDGSSVSIDVGPFFTQSGEDTTVLWRVFGGAERDYDQPLWNGYAGQGEAQDVFRAEINDYGAKHGFGFTTAGPDDTNPFTNWNELDVETCAIEKDDCKKGGFADFGFRNQGQCIQFVNTGKDSR